MRFTALSVENFKQFERAELGFSPGFTVVKGPNEAGKSSIQAAILAALFLDPRAPDSDIEEFIRWGQSNRFRLRLEFEDQGAQYILSKDFQAGSLSLQWTQAGDGVGGSTDDVPTALGIVGTLLGSASMDTYINTACIRGEEVSKVPSGAAPVSQRLQAKVTGGRQITATEVLRSIETELAAMASGGPRRLHETGVLRAARERIEALHRARTATAAKLAAHQENMRLLLRLREDLSAIEVETARRVDQLELSDRAQGLEEDIALLEEHRKELHRAEALRESVGQAAEELSGMDYETLVGALDRAQGLERQLQQQRLREAEINRQLAVLMLTEMQNAPAVSSAAMLLSGVVLATVCAIAAVLSHIPPLAAGVVPGLALVGYALKSRRTVRIDSSRGYTEELALCTEKIKAAQYELLHLLEGYGLHAIDELAAVVRETRPAGEMRAARQQRIARLLGDQRAETHQAALERVGHEIEVRQADLQVLAARRLSAGEYERADREVQALRARREGLLREMYRLEGELHANDVNSEMLASLDEELISEQVRLARLERRRKGLERAHSGMKEALAATLAQASAVFRTGVTKHLAPITGGRYDQVDARIDEEGLHLLVYTADKHRAVRADSLSRATQDQIYLAARMSLLELVCEGRRPPLLLDDPFVNYDDSRVENTIRLLRELYGEHQIVLFTCTGRYDRHADTVIALNGPRMVAEASATVAAS
jgi:DNA repair exonuclease SbcCD ATPase subunit